MKGKIPLRDLDREQKDTTMDWLWGWMAAWFGADVWSRNAPDAVRGTWEVVLGDCTGEDFKRGLRATRNAEDRYPFGAGKFLSRCRAEIEGVVPQIEDVPMSKDEAALAFDNLFTAKQTSSAIARKHIAACRRNLDGEKFDEPEKEDLGLMSLDLMAKESGASHYAMMHQHSLSIGYLDAWKRHVPGCDCQRCERARGLRP